MPLIYGLCCWCGYLVGTFIGGHTEGEPGLIHWDCFLQTFRIHLHHWFLATVLLVVYLATYTRWNHLVIAFLLGLIVQGLTYADRFDFGVHGTKQQKLL